MASTPSQDSFVNIFCKYKIYLVVFQFTAFQVVTPWLEYVFEIYLFFEAKNKPKTIINNNHEKY